MSVNSDWRTYALLISVALSAICGLSALFFATLKRPVAARWFRALAKGIFVFFLTFVLLGLSALFAPLALSKLGLNMAARLIDEPEAAILLAIVAGAVGSAAFWESFHRRRQSSDTDHGLSE